MDTYRWAYRSISIRDAELTFVVVTNSGTNSRFVCCSTMVDGSLSRRR
jgi:hypothetical protein